MTRCKNLNITYLILTYEFKMPLVYARHVQEIGGTGISQIALSVQDEPSSRTFRGPNWLLKYMGEDLESRSQAYQSYREARQIIEATAGRLREYIFTDPAGCKTVRSERWDISTAPMNREEYIGLIQRLRRIPGIAFPDGLSTDDYWHKSHLDHLIVQLVQSNQGVVPQPATK